MKDTEEPACFHKLLGDADAHLNLRAHDCKITYFSEPKNSSGLEFHLSFGPVSGLTPDVHTISGIRAANRLSSLALLSIVTSR